MDEPKQRPWWKRKHWWGALALWLMLPTAYVLGAGPSVYMQWRGWPSPGGLGIYAPLEITIEAAPMPVQTAADDYLQWWIRLAVEHRRASY